MRAGTVTPAEAAEILRVPSEKQVSDAEPSNKFDVGTSTRDAERRGQHSHAERGNEEVDGVEAAVSLGLSWLIPRVEDGRFREPAPIGFYFAKLWYFEALYPLIFSVAALRKAVETTWDEATQNRNRN